MKFKVYDCYIYIITEKCILILFAFLFVVLLNMVLKTLSREVSILEDSNTKSYKDFEVKSTQKCEIELAENEQAERVNILLSGIAIILLGNITSALILNAFELSVFGEIKQRTFLPNQQKGNILLI